MTALLALVALVPAAHAGLYVEAGVGLAAPLSSPVLDPGRHHDLGAGLALHLGERVLRLGLALGWSHHDGTFYAFQGDLLAEGELEASDLLQGDTSLRSAVVRADLALPVHPRIGVGLRIDAGLGTAPVLMDLDAYFEEAVVEAWGGETPALHHDPHLVVGLGPQLTWTSPAGVGIGVHPGLTYRLHLGLGALLAVQLSWEKRPEG